MQHTIYFSDNYDPYHNLAVEEMLFDLHENGCTFYLWQNQNTVVIGKNQNAWKECRIALLEQECGKLARRPSGGGAVFHDLGNLNFTFLLPRNQYDVQRQLSVIQKACSLFGIETEFTGRNDLVVKESGAKFSGNAFRFTKDYALHHGTVLVDVDMDKLSRFLAPSPEKFQSKGVDSVRARITNLHALNKKLTIESMKKALTDAFVSIYGPARLGQIAALDQQELRRRIEKLASWEWRIGSSPRFDISLEHRFDWGGLEMQLKLKNGVIEEAAVYSDAMDEALIEHLGPALIGVPFHSSNIGAKLRELNHPLADEIAAWMEGTGF